jgi:hypothetical protein
MDTLFLLWCFLVKRVEHNIKDGPLRILVVFMEFHGYEGGA